jgi:DNA-binding response OmpR family regulator
MSNQLILVVDDEPTIVEVVELYLKREGYRVITANSGPQALTLATEQRPDLIVLDLMLPELSGLEVTRQLRLHGHIPIIMLTARTEETDRVVGLELGADDYVTKPFSPRELVARVKAVLRLMAAVATNQSSSSTTAVQQQILVVGGLRMDVGARAVTLDGQAITLTVREFDLLLFLMRYPGQVFTREQLLDQVWGYTFASDMSTVTVHIRRLREKIEGDPANPQLLQTVWGIGYKLERGG